MTGIKENGIKHCYRTDKGNTLLEPSLKVLFIKVVLYCRNDKVKVVCKMLQADLCKVQDWCTKNRLSLNVKKTNFITFMSDHKRKNCMKFQLHMQGTCLEEVNTYRYLGTEIDNRLDIKNSNVCLKSLNREKNRLFVYVLFVSVPFLEREISPFF